MSEQQTQDGANTAPESSTKATYFDAVRHERVQRLKNKGVRVDLGPLWGNLVLRVRPFSHPNVVGAQEAAEKRERLNLGMRVDDDKKLPTVNQIEANRVAVRAAITGCAEGGIRPLPEQLEIARSAGFRIDDGIVIFDDTEDEKAVRDFFWPLIQVSHDFFARAIGASQQLRDIKDGEIDPLGDDFVVGRHVELELAV